jgi:hypothetical protein
VLGAQPEEEGRIRKEEGRKEKKERKKRKEDKRKRKERKKRKENSNRKREGKEIGKRFRKLGEFLGKLGGRILWGFPVSGVSVIFGIAVTARRTGRQDREGCGVIGVVADSSVGAARWATARVRAVPAEFAARAPSVREGKGDRGFEWE